MPSCKEHAKLSKVRIGKPFTELHEWMNEEYSNPNIPKRHDIIKIPSNLETVKEKFGDEAVEEFLYHIKEDYENNPVHKIIKVLSTLKRAVFSPVNMLKRRNTK